MHSMYVHTYYAVDPESRYNSPLDNTWLENYWYCKLFIRIPNTSNIKVLFNIDWTLQRDSRFHRYTPWIPEYLSFLYTTRHYAPDNHMRLAHFTHLTANIACHIKCSFNNAKAILLLITSSGIGVFSRRGTFTLCMVSARFYSVIFSGKCQQLVLAECTRNVYFRKQTKFGIRFTPKFPGRDNHLGRADLRRIHTSVTDTGKCELLDFKTAKRFFLPLTLIALNRRGTDVCESAFKGLHTLSAPNNWSLSGFLSREVWNKLKMLWLHFVLGIFMHINKFVWYTFVKYCPSFSAAAATSATNRGLLISLMFPGKNKNENSKSVL